MRDQAIVLRKSFDAEKAAREEANTAAEEGLLQLKNEHDQDLADAKKKAKKYVEEPISQLKKEHDQALVDAEDT